MIYTKPKIIVFKFISICLGILVLFSILEITLRFFPVHQGSHLLSVDQHNPMWRFEPNRTFIWSRGWNFNWVNEVNINNLGFVSDIDYNSDLSTPLLAIIGDSYVEAIYLPFKETISGRMNKYFGHHARVYSFAKSGAPLTQYLVYAEYARREFQPDCMVIVVVANDFDESFAQYAYEPGHHHFLENSNGEIILTRNDYSPSLVKRILRKFALARYLVLNVDIARIPQRIRNLVTNDNDFNAYVGNTSSQADIVRIDYAQKAIQKFLSLLPEKSGLESSRILFVMDGIRPCYNKSYLAKTKNSYFYLMRQFFIQSVKAKNYEIIDMHSKFIDDYKKKGKMFEFPNDGHWNAYAHKVVFETMIQSHLLKNFPTKNNDC